MMLPTGYGYAYKTTDHWLLNYMLHNQLSKPSQVWVTYDIDFIPADIAGAPRDQARGPDLDGRPERRAYPVFDVIQGSGQEREYTYPDDATNPYPRGAARTSGPSTYDGTLLATAGHVHPGGLHDDLWLTRAGATGLPGHTKPGSPDTAHLFYSVATYFEPAGGVSWDVAMSATPATWQVVVHKGDVMSINTTYNSKDASWYESMGIMVVWLAPNDTTGRRPVQAHRGRREGRADARPPRRERQPRRRTRSEALRGRR